VCDAEQGLSLESILHRRLNECVSLEIHTTCRFVANDDLRAANKGSA
jgi:hypothetical protein